MTVDIIEKAAQIIYDSLSGKYGDFRMPTEAAQALADAGVLARADRRTYRTLPPGMVWQDYYSPQEALDLLAGRDDQINRLETEVERQKRVLDWMQEQARNSNLAHAEQIDRADRAEAKLDRALSLLREIVDPTSCEFDHNGGCQEHGFTALGPGETCPVADAKAMLAEGEQS